MARRPGDLDRRDGSPFRVGVATWKNGEVRDQRDYVLRTVEERGIRFVQLWFTDVLGTPKTFNITPAELENALDEGMTFDGSAIDGFSRIQESDVLARPDADTFQLIPWHGHDEPVARVFCDIFNLDQTPFEGCPRHALRRTLERAQAAGYTFFASPEVEYFYFADTEVDPTRPPRPIDSGSYFDLTGADPSSDLRRRTVLTLEEMGIPVEHAQHEDAPGPARDRPALHGRADHGRHGDDRAPGGEGAGPQGAHPRQLHAQAAGGRPGLRDAHPPVALGGGAQRVRRLRATTTGSRRWPSTSSPDCSATPERSRPSPTSGSTRTSGSSSATRRRST